MELFSDLFSLLDEMALMIATAVGAIWFALTTFLSRFGFAILTGLGRGAGTGIGSRLTGSGGGSMGSRRMPTNPTPRHARQALWQAEARQQRMQLYTQVWFDLLAVRGGPYALSIYLHSLVHPGFQEKVNRLRYRCREFDRLEEKAQRIVQRYETRYERDCQPIRDELRGLNVQMSGWKVRHKRFAFRIWRRRWWYHKRQHWRLRRAIIRRRVDLQNAEWKLNLRFRARMTPALVEVDQFERSHLTHWVHSFEADLESFRLTVVTGRLIDMLSRNANDALLRRLGLESLSPRREELRAQIKSYLDHRHVGYGPQATLETLFEMYLRHRLNEDDALAEAWGVNRVWLRACLPAPAAIGVSHQRYYHLEEADGWLKAAQSNDRPASDLSTAAPV